MPESKKWSLKSVALAVKSKSKWSIVWHGVSHRVSLKGVFNLFKASKTSTFLTQ